MPEITMTDFNRETILSRILYCKEISKSAPSVIIFAGIHGNEPAGILGVQKVTDRIYKENIEFKGNFYALAGNLNALRKNIRFETSDLNRIWTKERIRYLNGSTHNDNAELKEQLELHQIIKDIVSKNQGPFYFIDLHTTSSRTIPFVTISDSLNNRLFTSNIALPIVLGIEEYLDGPLLTYINEFGHVSLGFEAGQHEDVLSIENCEAFCWVCLEIAGCIDSKDVKNYNGYKQALSSNYKYKDFYEIDEIYRLKEHEDFMMIDSFENFTPIKKNQVLAISNNQEIKASMNGQLFMPLYQKQGNEGFFIINKISKFWLQLSILVRKLKLYNLLIMLPGIQKDSSNKYVLIVNPRVAKFLTTEIFHLFGYRKKIKKGNKLYFIRRDRKIIDIT